MATRIMTMMMVIYRHYDEACLFVTKNRHFLQKICTFWTFWISNMRARGSKPDIENIPTCNCQNYILAQRSRLLVGQLGPSNNIGDNENGYVADDADKDGNDDGDDDKDDALHSERTLVGHCVTLEETSPTPLLFPTNCHSWIHRH